MRRQIIVSGNDPLDSSGFGDAFKVSGLMSFRAHPTWISNLAEASTSRTFLHVWQAAQQY